MTKFAQLNLLASLLFFTIPAFAEWGDTFAPYGSAYSSPLNSCSVPGGSGVTANLPFRPDFAFGSGATTFCYVNKCHVGYELRGAICLPIPKIQSCHIKNGSGRQERYAGKWSVCKAQSCQAGYILRRGICLRRDDLQHGNSNVACQAKFGTGVIEKLSSDEKFCRVSVCQSGFEKQGNTCVLIGAPKVKVNLVIIRKDDGSGNEKWNSIYIHRMVDQLTDLTNGNVKFYLGRVISVPNTSDYTNTKQDKVKMNYIQFREYGAITGVVTQHDTTDSRGTAIGISNNYDPIFLFRSWYNDGSAKDSLWAAKVFLHELGHNMGMKHDYGGRVHMDNHYYERPSQIVSYTRGLDSCKTPNLQCVVKKSKFGNNLNVRFSSNR